MDAGDGYFDERVAARYDDPTAEPFSAETIEPVVDLLAELAGGGRALELGIGTGRIALPLADRGVPVHGIDLSRAMVAKLHEKPCNQEIGVTIGDFATTTVDGTFSVAYLVFNTIENLTTQEAQVVCFRNVAAHLEPGGCFVIEVDVPQLQRLPPGETFRVFHARRRTGCRAKPQNRSSTHRRCGLRPRRLTSALRQPTIRPKSSWPRRSRGRTSVGSGPARIRTWDRPVMSRLL